MYLVQHYLDNAREFNPGGIAAVSPEAKITYEHVYTLSNKLANFLLSISLSRQARVILALERSPKCIVAMLGILKADAIYVPIDPKSPLERWTQIIDDSGPSALICDSRTINKTTQARSRSKHAPQLICLDYTYNLLNASEVDVTTQLLIDTQSDEKPDYRNTDKDTAYILYTSGSTGLPKGVMISHLNIVNYINWAVECFNITQKDFILNTAPFHFDMSTFDIYSALKSCATLCIAPDNLILFPPKLFDFMKKHQITIWKGVSSLLMYLAKTGAIKSATIPTLKKILFGGEVLPTKYLIEWMRTFPDKKFYNVYGPTEATGISTYYHINTIPKDNSMSIPIGKPCKNTEVYLLKENNSMARMGDIGEIYIRGSGVGMGYWNAPGKTSKAFVPNPITQISSDIVYRTGDLAQLLDDGNLVYIGRSDNQIKWMGHRIELEEIETALLSVKQIKDAAVSLFIDEKSDLKELVAFVEADNNINVSELITELSSKIPHYMLPRRILQVPSIPRNDRGKVERNALLNIL